MGNVEANKPWHRLSRNSVHNTIFETVRRFEAEQSDVFDRLDKLEALYDPNGPDASDAGEQLSHVQENVIASNVDTVHAVVSTSDVRARFMTDGADWATQRRARHLEWYAEEIAKLYDILPACRKAFKEAAKKGNGLVKVWQCLEQLRVEHVLVENLVVDPNECRDGKAPKQIHEWAFVDVDELIARYPRYRDEIEAARGSNENGRYTRSFMTENNELQVLYSYRLPTGRKGKKGYRAGRFTCCIAGQTLEDVTYEKESFPYAMHVWSDRLNSWYGISGAERIAGIQRALNKRNWQIEKQLDNSAVPTTYVRPVDAALAQKKSRVNGYAVAKGDWPHQHVPIAVSGETYKSRVDLRESAFNEFGVSQMQAHAAKPAGLDSGAAIREYRDETTQRFAPQERNFENIVLRAIELAIGVCKDMGAAAPTIMRKSRFGKKKLEWSQVDMGDVRVMIAPASTLGRTPSGRVQLVLELAQAGIINTDTTRRLIKHPDLERELSLYTAALENIEHALDEIADGKYVMPEPFMNLGMIVWRGQAEYLQWRDDGAPEDRLEDIRQFVVQAAWMKSQEAANANAAPAATDPMLDPMAANANALPADPMAPPALPGGAPATVAPQAALAAQAMQLQAS